MAQNNTDIKTNEVPTTSGFVGRLAQPISTKLNNPAFKQTGEIMQAPVNMTDAPIFKIPVIGPVVKGAFDSVKSSFEGAASKFSDLFSSLTAQSYEKDRPKDINQPTGSTIGMTPEQRQSFYDQKQQEGSILNKLVKTGEAGLSLVNFYPPIAQFNAELAAAKNLPGPLSAPAKAIDWGFGKASEIGASLMGKGIDELQNTGAIKPETANTIKPLTQDLASFATLIIGAKVGFKAMEQGLGKGVESLPVSPETGAKINKGVQTAVGFSMQPFSTAYGLTQGLLMSKIEQRRQQGIDITPQEVVKIGNEVKTELPRVIDETKVTPTEQPTVPPTVSTMPQVESKPTVEANPLTSSISQAKASGQSFDEWMKGQGGRYHGTSNNLDKVFEGDSMYSTQNIYGQGFYTTDNLGIAEGYSKKGKGGEPSVYHIQEKNTVPIYDLEKPMDSAVLDAVNNFDIAQNAPWKKGETLRTVFDDIRDLSGSGEFSADTAQEYFDSIKSILEDKGYRGVEHIGGQFTGKEPHNVKIYWKPESDLSFSKGQTRSQLTDIWNKAQEVKPIEVPTVPPVTPKTPEQTQFTSRVFERLQAERPDILQGDLIVEKRRLQEDLNKATSLIETDKQKAYKIAMGVEKSTDISSTSANIVMAEKALQDGNYDLYSKLVRARSLDLTRKGFDIAAERGSITDNSTAKYVKELIASRLDALGKTYLGNLRRISEKSKAMTKIDGEVSKLEKQIKNKKLDVKTAMSLLDKLTCV